MACLACSSTSIYFQKTERSTFAFDLYTYFQKYPRKVTYYLNVTTL